MSDNDVNIVWETPENENGVLLYYRVTIYNVLRNYTEVVRLTPDQAKSVNYDDLGKSRRRRSVKIGDSIQFCTLQPVTAVAFSSCSMYRT